MQYIFIIYIFHIFSDTFFFSWGTIRKVCHSMLNGNEWEPTVTNGNQIEIFRILRIFKNMRIFERYVLRFVINGNAMVNYRENSNGIFHYV